MSIHIEVKSAERMPILDLWRLIFKFTFDKKSCAHSAQKTIETELLKWNGFVKMQKAREIEKYGLTSDFTPVGTKGSVLDELEYQVGYMCSWLVREENGDFQRLVDTYTRAKIDYRLAEPMCKVFPDCKHLRNPKRGQEYLKQNMKDYPEHYQ